QSQHSAYPRPVTPTLVDMDPLPIVLFVAAFCGLGAAIIGTIAWRRALGRAKRVRALNWEAPDTLKEEDELPQVASTLGVLNRVAVVYNPSKPAAEQACPLVAQACAIFGLAEPKFYASAPKDSGLAATQQAIDDGAQLIVVAGGDGTVRAAAKMLVNTDVHMGIIPTGTGNLLARNLNLPLNDVHACISIAFNGRVRPVDVVSLDVVHADGGRDNMVSVVIAGAGYDAQIMHSASDRLKAAAGWLAYTEAGVRHLRGKRHAVLVSTDGGEPKRYRVRSAMGAKCGYLTGGLDMLPDAVMDDGLLDVTLLDPRRLVVGDGLVAVGLLEPRHRGDWMQVATAGLTAKRKRPRVTRVQARSCKLVFDEPLVAQIDGDPIPKVKEIQAETIPLSLRVRVPADSTEDQ